MTDRRALLAADLGVVGMLRVVDDTLPHLVVADQPIVVRVVGFDPSSRT
jgi:hypothetical protein